jgi:hypothetical protein
MGKFNRIKVQYVDESIREPTTKTIEGCKQLADRLFADIRDRFGEAEARRIFSSCGKPPRFPDHEWKKLKVVCLYYGMKPRPNKLALAKELAEKNRTLPHQERFAKGSTDTNTMYKYIDRAIKEHKRKTPNIHLLLEQLQGNTKPDRRANARRRRLVHFSQ